MARILLVNSPFYRLMGSHYNANSLGIAYICAQLRAAGHEAMLYNADFVDRTEYANLKGLFSGFDDYKCYFEQPDEHPIWAEVVERILAFNPDWVGYTSYTANVAAIDILSKRVRERAPDVRQVIGGPHATLDKSVLDRLPAIDFAVAREGEHVMVQLVEGVDPKTLAGVASRGLLGIKHNGDAEVLDADQLELPERKAFWGLTEEQARTVDVSYVVTIRGCPYRCNYCASPYAWKRNKTQYRSPESVLSELEHLKAEHWQQDKQYDYAQSANAQRKEQLLIKDNTLVYFVDDVFTIRRGRVKTILRGMVERQLDMPWKCEARTDHLDEETCQLMAQAGCRRVKLGFESGSDRILLQIQKDETKEEMRAGAQMLRQAGVPFTAYFMAGFPGETDEDLRETIAFAREIRADYYSLSVLAPYYGTKLYFDLVERGFPLEQQPWEYFFHQTGEMLVNVAITKPVLEEYLALNELNEGKGYV